MKNLIPLLFICICITSTAQTKYDLQLQFEGRNREFIVSVPTKQPPQGGYPLVFMLHGSSGDKNVFYNSKGWKELGQQENFVTVFPSALKWCSVENGDNRVIARFVCGALLDSICPSEIPKLISDVGFLKKLVSLIKDTLPINNNKVFISGFSNGSAMTHKMAMDAGDIFSAAGCSSGSFHELDSVAPVRRIPIWFMVGTKDDRYLTPKYPVEMPFNDSILNYLYRVLNRTVICQGLTQKYTKMESTNSISYIFTECRPGETCAPYIFTLNKDQKHFYPNGNNYPLDAPRLFWDFFNDPPETTSSSETRESVIDASTVLLPNPASQNLTIVTGFSMGTKWNYMITDTQGRIVMKQQNISIPDIDLDISQLPAGLYNVTMTDNNYTISRRLVKQF